MKYNLQSQVSLFTSALWYDGKIHPLVFVSDELTHSKETLTVVGYYFRKNTKAY
jgi:hypothetical protein